MWGTQGSSSGCQTCYQVPLSTESFCVPLLNFLAKALHFFHSKPCGLERVASYSWKGICWAVWGLVLFHLLLPSVGHWVRIEGCSNEQLKIWPNKKFWAVLWIELVNFQVTESMSHSRESVAYRRCPVHHKEDRGDVFRSFHFTWTGICFRMPVYKVAWASQTAQGSCCQKVPKAFNGETFLPGSL